MNKILFLVLSIFFMYSCGSFNSENNILVSNNSNVFIKNENDIKKLEIRYKNYDSPIPVIKRIKSFNELKKDKIYTNKIKKMNYSGENPSMKLSVCREPGKESFLFEYMSLMLNNYVGREFLHLDTREPVEIIDTHGNIPQLPFFTNLKNSYFEHHRMYSFSSYFSINDSILYNLLSIEDENGYKFLKPRKNNDNDYSITGFYYSGSFLIPKVRLNGMEHPALYRENGMFYPYCWSPRSTSYNENDNFLNYLSHEEFNFQYNFNSENSVTNGLCSLSNEQEIIEVGKGPLAGGMNIMGHYVHSFLWSDFPNGTLIPDTCLISDVFTDTCFLYDYKISEDCNQSDLYNMYIAENRLRNEQNPNSYNIHFPFNPILLYGRNTDTGRGGNWGWITPDIDVTYLITMNFTGLDIVTDTNTNAIVQSALLEKNLSDDIINNITTNRSSCFNYYRQISNDVANNICGEISDIQAFLSKTLFSRSCFDTLISKTEDDLIEYFYNFSQNPNSYTQNEKECVHIAWMLYAPTKVKFEGKIWDPVLNSQILSNISSRYGNSCTKWTENLNDEIEEFDSCKERAFNYRERLECNCDILPGENSCTSIPNPNRYGDDIPAVCEGNLECQTASDCIDKGTGFGVECFTQGPVPVSGIKTCQVSLNYAVNYFNSHDRDWEQTFNHSQLGNLVIDITPDKLEVEKLFMFNGGMNLIRKALHHSYYHFISVHKDCEKLGMSCDDSLTCTINEDCNILQKKCPENDVECNDSNMIDNGLQYGCFKKNEDYTGVCSTPLAAISINARTLNNNFYDPYYNDPAMELWIKYDVDSAHINFDNLSDISWASEKSTLDINMDSIIYLVPIMVNGNLMIDYYPMLSDGTSIVFRDFHLETNVALDIGNLVENSVRKIAIDTAEEEIKDLLTSLNPGSIDIKFNILREIENYFSKLTINSLELIDNILKDDEYPKWNEVETSLNKFGIFNF